MRELKYGSQMQDRIYAHGDPIKWIFPENVHIDKDTLYEVEYIESNNSDPSDFSCIYKVTYIKPVSILVERINYIVNIFNKMNQADAFEKWFREHYKLLVVK